MKIPELAHIYPLGAHKALDESGFYNARSFTLTEKIDGSQFSWGLIDGTLHFRSRGGMIDASNPPGMFKPCIEHLQSISLNCFEEGCVYRGEAVTKAKHNSLTYSRSATGGIVLFHIDSPPGTSTPSLRTTSYSMRLDYVNPTVLMVADGLSAPETKEFLLQKVKEYLNELNPLLGGAMAEGVVVKPTPSAYALDKKEVWAKLVRPEFQEVHRREWKSPLIGGSAEERLVKELTTTQRWLKAVQHLREAGSLLEEPKDIGPLIHEVQEDIRRECLPYITEVLTKEFFRKHGKTFTRGLPEWYKSLLQKGLDNATNHESKENS